jgi:hypothetical protein
MSQVPELGNPEGDFAFDPFFRDNFADRGRHTKNTVPENHGGNIREIGKDSHGNSKVTKEGKREILILIKSQTGPSFRKP